MYNNKINRLIFLIALFNEWKLFYTLNRENLILVKSEKSQYLYKLKNKNIFFFQTGTGPIIHYNILKRFNDISDNTLFINLGTAGILRRDTFSIGEIIIPHFIGHIDYTKNIENYKIDYPLQLSKYCHLLLTSTTPVIKKDRCDFLIQTYLADLVDMEAYYHCLFCRKKNFPFISIKICSDFCNENTKSIFQINLQLIQKKIVNILESIIHDWKK